MRGAAGEVARSRSRGGLATSRIITATFQDGILKPDQPLDLPTPSRVRLVVEAIEDSTEMDRDAAWQELERLWDEVEIDSGGERMTRDQLHDRH